MVKDMNINEYIKNSWKKTIQKPVNGIPFPFTSPCITDTFLDFFYWDVYFINKGLYLDGFEKQAENNINNIAYFIEKLGFMPNANTLTNRSQPPFFAKMVYDFYEYTQDKGVIKKYLPTLLKEYDFWMTKRVTLCGLNAYGEDSTDAELEENYIGLCDRVLEYRETREEQFALAKDILAMAESGLDFNMRFVTERSKVDIGNFVQLDINCILHEVETLISKMFALLDDTEGAEKFSAFAEKRKNLINEILWDNENGLYLDYNQKDKCFSKIVTAISLYPYIFGVSDDKEGAKKVLARLEQENGLCVGEYRGDNAVYFQWDYPCMWPAATCLVYEGLKKIGLTEDAKRIAKKYNKVVAYNFQKTGKIWEKYDAITGEVAQTLQEYGTPEMLGWSAAVYRYFEEELKNSK